MTIADIFDLAQDFINKILREEIIAQGHHLTGKMEESLHGVKSSRGRTDLLEGFAIFYAQFVDQGFPASSANFSQAPFLIEFFQKRGLSPKEATGAAFATIKVWMRDGMPSQASKRFSQTGSRTNFVSNAIAGKASEIDEFIGSKIDIAVDELFKREKSETI